MADQLYENLVPQEQQKGGVTTGKVLLPPPSEPDQKKPAKSNKSQHGGVVDDQLKRLREVVNDMNRSLYEVQTPAIKNVLKTFESNTGAKREQLAYGVIAFLTVYLLVGSSASLVSTIIGLAYPAYLTMKIFRSPWKNDAEQTRLMTIWLTVGFFYALDAWGEDLQQHFKVYYLFKAGVLVYLALPQTQGTKLLHDNILRYPMNGFPRVVCDVGWE